MTTSTQRLWSETPLIRSGYFSRRLGCNVYLKLENLQPSQSFKYRGVSLLAHRCVQQHGSQTHLIAASSGNAGYAVAYAAKELGVRSTIYLHVGVSESTVRLLESVDARVVVVGHTYQEALGEAMKEVAGDEHAILVPAYDHPVLWEGHASMVEEMAKQLPQSGDGPVKPDAIFCSVGGGGLIGGIIEGRDRVSWTDEVPIVAMETHGSNCFYESMLLNKQPSRPIPENVIKSESVDGIALASLKQLTSKAASLGATTASTGVVQMALKRGRIFNVTVQDEMSMMAAARFADEHKMLVELACSTTLAPAYSEATFSKIMRAAGAISGDESIQGKTVVFVVCGGVKISLSEMDEYQSIVESTTSAAGYEWTVRCEGDEWKVPV